MLAVADAVLYEGYLLYPYRAGALKNRYRWLFGVLFPQDYCQAVGNSEPWFMQSECLLRGGPESQVDVRFRCLHVGQASTETTASGQDAVTEDFITAEKLDNLLAGPKEIALQFVEQDNKLLPIRGRLILAMHPVEAGIFRLTIRVENLTEQINMERMTRDEALLQALISSQLILRVHEGEFISLLDPPEGLRSAVTSCQNVGTWPILVGERTRRDQMFCAPMILEDFPQVAPESAGPFFDGTEIDELLTLRVMTLTEQEKQAMQATDERAKAILSRTEQFGAEDLLRLHGAVREFQPRSRFRPGDRVRLHPRPGSDVFDLALAGKVALVHAIEQDYEGREFLSVVIEDDPGQDLGLEGKPGHRFFYRPDEVELLVPQPEAGQ
jgi:hypothetical protein